MHITRYQFQDFYPYLLLECEVVYQGKKYYVDLEVNNYGQKITNDYTTWEFDRPLQDREDDGSENAVYDVKFDDVIHEMIEFWNNNPKFIENDSWNPWTR